MLSKGIYIERKSLYRNIQLLNDIYRKNAIDYVTYDNHKKGYYIQLRDFELRELQLMIDGVQSSKFITQKMANQITQKIIKLANKFERPMLRRQQYVSNRIRSMSDSAFLNVNNIHEAIALKCKITFQYFKYNIKKRKQYNKTKYSVSPFALQWSDNNYYLIAYQDHQIKHFRVDKMDNIEIESEEKAEGVEIFKSIDLSARAIKMFSMFHGKEQRVKLRFNNHLADSVLDRFGHDVSIIKEDNEHFIVYVNVEISPTFWGWLLGFGKAVMILSPEHVVDEFSKYISDVSQMYKIRKRLQEL